MGNQSPNVGAALESISTEYHVKLEGGGNPGDGVAVPHCQTETRGTTRHTVAGQSKPWYIQFTTHS